MAQNYRRQGGQGGGQQKPPRIEFDTGDTGTRVVLSADPARPGYFVHIFGRALDGNQTIEGGMFVYGRKLPAADNVIVFCDGAEQERLTLRTGTGQFDAVFYYTGPDNPFGNTVKVGIQLVGTVVKEEISLQLPDKAIVQAVHTVDTSGWSVEMDSAKAEAVAGGSVRITVQGHVAKGGRVVLGTEVLKLGVDAVKFAVVGSAAQEYCTVQNDGTMSGQAVFKPADGDTRATIRLSIAPIGLFGDRAVELPQPKVPEPAKPDPDTTGWAVQIDPIRAELQGDDVKLIVSARVEKGGRQVAGSEINKLGTKPVALTILTTTAATSIAAQTDGSITGELTLKPAADQKLATVRVRLDAAGLFGDRTVELPAKAEVKAAAKPQTFTVTAIGKVDVPTQDQQFRFRVVVRDEKGEGVKGHVVVNCARSAQEHDTNDQGTWEFTWQAQHMNDEVTITVDGIEGSQTLTPQDWR